MKTNAEKLFSRILLYELKDSARYLAIIQFFQIFFFQRNYCVAR